jgi:hypothetical protein
MKRKAAKYTADLTDRYTKFVDHPRYGQRPNLTGLNPDPTRANVNLHWSTKTFQEVVAKYEAIVGKKWPHGDYSASMKGQRIPNTAIAADTSRQIATVPVTHYFDLERHCCDCQRLFIFFADEQKYWYEELGFTLNSSCVRCVECRKEQQRIARQRKRYESLFQITARTVEQTLEMAEICLSLIEADVFTSRQLIRVRTLLNTISADEPAAVQSQVDDLRFRVKLVDSKRE